MVSRTMGVSRAQLSLRINRSADWQDRRCNRRNEEADAEILSAILNIISDMPSYGYRRVWGILRKQRRTEGQPPVNAKRLYRIMRELSAIGNRINQLAAKANALNFIDTPMLREEARKWHDFQLDVRKKYLLPRKVS